MPETDNNQNPDGRAKPLPADVQEHLARELRSALDVEMPKPAYLGDTGLPPAFDGLVRKLEQADRPSRAGLDAVRRALQPGEDPAADGSST